MRFRFFITIFIVLAISAASVSAIHYHFFKLERLRLIEINLQQNATLISDSDLSLSRKEFSSLGEEFINEVIGDDKVNMIVAIYSAGGNILYRNENAYIFELPDRINPDFSLWEDVEKKEYLIKYLTKRDAKNNRIIKVGMILNQSLLRWKDLNQRIFIFVGIILSVITIISFFLTYILFRPVKSLAEQVNLMAEKIESGEFMELQSWFNMLKSKHRVNDEFNSLLTSLDKLAKKVTENQLLTQRWSALMAHELKTPMTLLRVSMEEMILKTGIPQQSISAIETELQKLEDIIMDFLDWASVENDTSKTEIYAINIANRARDFVNYFEKNNKTTEINFNELASDDLRVFCNPIHFDQVLNNILTNASKYGNGEISITYEAGKLTFSDNGPGIPDAVLENFGKPFNKYAQGGHSGHGLGLAWINTIAKRYHWDLNFENSSGTKITITFPNN